MIISVINQKGGVGKSTALINLAAALRESGHKVAVIDTDDQETAYGYRAAVKGVKFSLATLVNLAEVLGKQKADFVLVDSPRSLNDDEAAIILKLVDLAIIATENEIDSYVALLRTVQVAKQIQADGRPDLQYRVLLSKNSGADHRKEIRADIKNNCGPQMLKAALPNSTVFGRAAFHGETVLDHAPDSTAAKACRKLAVEVEKMKNGA
jgi:chromosome partitioning protein